MRVIKIKEIGQDTIIVGFWKVKDIDRSSDWRLMKYLRQLECYNKVICGDSVVRGQCYGKVGNTFIGVCENKVKDVTFDVRRLIN